MPSARLLWPQLLVAQVGPDDPEERGGSPMGFGNAMNPASVAAPGRHARRRRQPTSSAPPRSAGTGRGPDTHRVPTGVDRKSLPGHPWGLRNSSAKSIACSGRSGTPAGSGSRNTECAGSSGASRGPCSWAGQLAAQGKGSRGDATQIENTRRTAHAGTGSAPSSG